MRSGLKLLLGAALAMFPICPAWAASPPWPLGPEFQISGAELTASRLAIDTNADGVAVVVWTSSTKGETLVRVYARIYAPDGTPAGEPIVVAESLLGPILWLDHPSVALAADGTFVAGWQGTDADDEGFFARRFAADGSPLGAAFVVSQVETSGQLFPRLAVAPGGGFVAVWSAVVAAPTGGVVYGRLFDAGGQPLTGDIPLATSSSPLLSPDVVALGGGFVATWQRGTGGSANIVARQLDASLAPVGAENVVASQLAPVVAAARDGGDPFFAIVSFGQSSGVSLRRFDQDGQGVGGAELVSGGLQQQSLPSVTFDDAGGVVVAWIDRSTPGAFQILGRRLAGRPPLTPPSDSFAMSAPENANFFGHTALAALPEGKFFVAWSDTVLRGRLFSSVLIFADGFESGDTAAWN